MDQDNSQQSSVPDIKIERKKKRRKKKRPPHKSKMITGYIIYASEIRKEVIKKYPDRDFGYISKLVGIEWKNLPAETKIAYEKRAQEQNAKSKAIAAEALELKKLADAAEEKAKREQASANAAVIAQPAFQDPHSQLQATTYNRIVVDGHSQPIMVNQQMIVSTQSSQLSSTPIKMPMQIEPQPNQLPNSPAFIKSIEFQQQQPSPFLQQHQHYQQQQPIVTTVQYDCNSNNRNPYQLQHQLLQTPEQSQSPIQAQYQRNNIVYRKPTTVKLRPKDATTQTESIKWVESKPKEPLKFSQKFMDYLNNDSNLSNVQRLKDQFNGHCG